ncbi:MAG: hypothetical protein K2V38_20925 [Gemmataceae bacterium]|nr:hypothetical protein [Gemmataceae bacterium]
MIDDTPKMAETVRERVPLGTPVDEAQAFMAREGFKCQRQTNAPFGDRDGLDYVYCDRAESKGWLVSRRWQIALVHRDGKVTEILAATGLVGP